MSMVSTLLSNRKINGIWYSQFFYLWYLWLMLLIFSTVCCEKLVKEINIMKKTDKIAKIELFCLAWIQLYNAPHRFFSFLKCIENIPKPFMILFIIVSIPIYIYGIYSFIKEKNKRDLIFSILFFLLFMAHAVDFLYHLL